MTTWRPYGLQTEQRHEPLGLGEPRPRLSWKLAQRPPGAAQSAYRITAAERAADLDDAAPAAVGQRPPGVRRRAARAVGRPGLRSATRYHWRVEVWDETGAAAGAAQSWFETGLLHRDDWTAVWIGRDPARPAAASTRPPTTTAPTSASRRCTCGASSTLAREPVRARLYATARGVYEPRLNGTRVGDLELAPGLDRVPPPAPVPDLRRHRPAARGRQRARRRSSPTAGGAGTSASTRAAPAAALRRPPGVPGPAGASTSPTAPGRWWPPTPAGPSGPARSASPTC